MSQRQFSCLLFTLVPHPNGEARRAHLIHFFSPLLVGRRIWGLPPGRSVRFLFGPFFGELQSPAVTAIIRVMIAGSLRAGCTSPPQTGSSVKSRSPQADPQPRAG